MRHILQHDHPHPQSLQWEARQQGVVHVALGALHASLNHGFHVARNFLQVFNDLISSPAVDKAYWCPLVNAAHYRLFDQLNMIYETLNSREQRHCLKELDIEGNHILHVTVKSKASGFARYFLRPTRDPTTDKFLDVIEPSSLTTAGVEKQTSKSLSFVELNNADSVGHRDTTWLLEQAKHVFDSPIPRDPDDEEVQTTLNEWFESCFCCLFLSLAHVSCLSLSLSLSGLGPF